MAEQGAEQVAKPFALESRNQEQELAKAKEKYEPPAWLEDSSWEYKMMYDDLARRELVVKTTGKDQPLPSQDEDPWRKKFAQKALKRWGWN